MGTATRFKHTDVPRQPGELARFKVVQGPDFGAVYVVMGERATIGRGETNDIIVGDLKASRQHAEAVFTGMEWKIRDLGSVNGILHNGKQSKEAPLRFSDTVTLGETTLEFVPSGEAGTMMLRAPARSPQELAESQAALEEQKGRIKKLTTMGSLKELTSGLTAGADGGEMAKAQRRKLLIYGVAGIMLAWTMMEEDKPKPKGRKPAARQQKQAEAELAKYLPGAQKEESNSVSKTTEMLFRLGFREYREKNYIRAKANFETVLQVDPGHRLSRLYLNNCVAEIDREIKSHLEDGKKDIAAGKLRTAKGHFEQTMRLLHYDQSNPAYKEAQDQLTKVNEQLKRGY